MVHEQCFDAPADGCNRGDYSIAKTKAGTTASRFLRHVPKDRREVIALAQNLVDIRRAA